MCSTLVVRGSPLATVGPVGAFGTAQRPVRQLLQSSGTCGPGNVSVSGTCTPCSPGSFAPGSSASFSLGVDSTCNAFANPGVIFTQTARPGVATRATHRPVLTHAWQVYMSCAFSSAPSFAVGAVGACTWPYTLLSYLQFLNQGTQHYALTAATIVLPGGLLAANCTVQYSTGSSATRANFSTRADCLFDAAGAMAVNASGCGVLHASQVVYEPDLRAFQPFQTSLVVQGTSLSGGAASCTTCPAGTNCSFAGTAQPDPCPRVRASGTEEAWEQGLT